MDVLPLCTPFPPAKCGNESENSEDKVSSVSRPFTIPIADCSGACGQMMTMMMMIKKIMIMEKMMIMKKIMMLTMIMKMRLMMIMKTMAVVAVAVVVALIS